MRIAEYALAVPGHQPPRAPAAGHTRCRGLNLRGNLVPDAYLAAIAFEQRAELVTFDRGFGRYPRLRWRCLIGQ